MAGRIDERTPLLQASSFEQIGHASAPLVLGRFIGALTQGSLPSTQQFCHCLDALLQSHFLAFEQPTRLDGNAAANGTALLLAIRKFLVALRQYLSLHLSNNALQSLVFESKQSRVGLNFEVPTGMSNQLCMAFSNLRTVRDVASKAPDPVKVQNDALTVLFALQSLLRLFLFNILATSQSILDDAFFLARTAMSDVAEEVANVGQEVADVLRPEEGPPDREGPLQPEKVEQQTTDLIHTLEEGKEAVVEAATDLTTLKARVQTSVNQDFRRVATARLHKVHPLSSPSVLTCSCKLIDRIRENPAASRSTLILLDMLRKYLLKTRDTIEAVEEAVTEPDLKVEVSDDEQHAQAALNAAKSLLEDLAGTTLAPLFATFDQLVEQIQSNHELSVYFEQLEQYVRLLISDPAYASSDAAIHEAQQLYDRAMELQQSHAAWRAHLNDLFRLAVLFYSSIVDNEELYNLRQAYLGVVASLTAFAWKSVDHLSVCLC